MLALALLTGAVSDRATPASEPSEPERLIFLLQYIAVDYGEAVRGGEVADPLEYAEMRRFSTRLVDRADDLQRWGASEEVLDGIRQLRAKIGALRPPSEVGALASGLAEELAKQLGVVSFPGEAPDLERGRRAYEQHCTGCHGKSGLGDGPAAHGLDPPPSSFGHARMRLLSPRHLHGAIRFGVEGTAMPAYDQLDPETVWDVAFFLMTLRSDFAPRPPKQELPLALADLAQHSDAELLARLRAAGVDIQPGHLDHYRASPGSLPRRAAATEAPTARQPGSKARRSGAPAGAGLEVARQLQDAFAEVAERVQPSVVGVTGLLRSDPGAPSDADQDGDADGWRGDSAARLYPGFRPARRGSGFLVRDDGTILTAHHLLADEDGGLVAAVDVELHDGSHALARVVGTEPTINLGVLQIERLDGTRLPELQPARIGSSEAIRVGHWAIALGNPAGPGSSFAVGTLSSRPARQCYQEELTATLMQLSLGVPVGGYGGPLVDIEGEVVGVVLPRRHVEPGEPLARDRRLEFALPIDLAMAIYEPLKTRASRRSPWLGFSVLELHSKLLREARSRDGSAASSTGAGARRPRRARRGVHVPRLGVYIDDVYEPSPAASADIHVGDRLLSIDGNRLYSVGAFQRWLYLSGIGRTITLEILRDGEVLEKRVQVEERPESVRPL